MLKNLVFLKRIANKFNDYAAKSLKHRQDQQRHDLPVFEPDRSNIMQDSLKIEWDESLETGNRAIDVQHKYLVDIINELAEAIEQGRTDGIIGKVLNLLKYYTLWHFEREEKCMDLYECPAAEINKAAHANFIKTFVQFQEEYRQSGDADDIARRMYNELTEWLVKHIKKVDMQIEPCMHRDES